MTSSRHFGALAPTIIAILLALGAWHSARAEPDAAPEKQPTGPVCDRAAFRLIVDVGHTAAVPGARSARGLYEFEFNLRLAKLVEQQLRGAGFGKTMLLVSEGRAMASLAHRVARANASGADLFLSIHHDSVPDQFLERWVYKGEPQIFSDRFKGHSLFVSNENPNYGSSLAFARLLGRQLKARGLQYAHQYTEKFMGHRQRLLVDPEAGVYRYDQLIVLKDTVMPAALLEAGSIINRDEELAMETPERQGLISAAVLAAVDSYCAAHRPVGGVKTAHPAPAHPAPARPKRAAATASPPAASTASAWSFPWSAKRP